MTTTETEVFLSLRQLQVIRLAARGLSNKQIAQRLYLSEESVKTHVKAAYRNLGVPLNGTSGASRMLAVQRGMELGLIALPGREA